MQSRLNHATLIDGRSGAPIADSAVIYDDGIITYAGPYADAPVTPDAKVIELSGHTVLPGFIDTHVHFGFGNGGPSIKDDLVLRNLAVFERMAKTLGAGITTVRDLGGLAHGFNLAQQQGLVVGPRLQSAVRIIGHTGGHCDATGADGVNQTGHFTILADDSTQVRTAVRTAIREGADVIKVCATGGMGSPHDDPDDEDLTEEEIRAAVGEARRHRGKKVAAHAQGTAGIINAIRGGVHSIEHGYGMTDEACDLALDAGVFLVPTLATAFHPMDPLKYTAAHFAKKSRWKERTRTNISHAIGRGVKIALGTDAGVSPHAENLLELSFLVELGMSPMSAIEAGTSNAAILMGLGEQIGTVAAGFTADLVVTNIDPLTNIRGLGDPHNIKMVIQGGMVKKDLVKRPLEPSFDDSASHLVHS